MIKVLHVCSSTMSRGGMETFLMNMYRCINREKIQFGFLVRGDQKGDYDEEIYKLGGEIFVAKTDWRYNHLKRVIKRFLDVYRIAKEHSEYKIIHIHASNAKCLLELLAASLAGRKVRIVHSHNSQSSSINFHKRLRFLIRVLSTHRFACSKAAGDWMFGSKFVALKNSRIIPNAIDIAPFIFDSKIRNEMRKELGVENKFVIGHVGRFVEQKNHMFLLEIFKKVIENREDAILLLTGRGDLIDEVKRQSIELGIDNNILFLGVREDINKLLMAMDCFVLPSLFEGLPVVLIEAQASGLKCFVSDTVSREAEITNNIKYISLEESPDQWAEYIVNMISNNNFNLRNDMTLQLTESGYNMRESVKMMERIYEE